MSRTRGSARPGRVRGLAVAMTLAAGGLVVSAAPAQAEDVDCADVAVDDPPADATAVSKPLVEMDIADARAAVPQLRRGATAGTGVGVAVVDSGVVPGGAPGRIPVAAGYLAAGQPPVVDYHGTAVAGLIAGQARADGTPIGVAPGASIVDVKVYDQEVADPENGLVAVDQNAVLAGLQWIASGASPVPIDIVNVSLAIGGDPVMAQVVDQLWAQGVIVVAPTGNRPAEPGDPLYEQFPEFTNDEDAQGVVFPAAYEHVVAVSTTVQGYGETPDDDAGIEPNSVVLQNSDTDVAAPSAGAVSLALNGAACVLTVPATSWATAEVSGILALLKSAYPDEAPAQLVARLTRTADGRQDLPSVYVGDGVVQPYDALTRPLAPNKDGALQETVIPPDPDARATAPVAEADVLRGTRHDAVWWGLLGGGALLLALVLRPVLARRRR